jgi:hypothetical protein
MRFLPRPDQARGDVGLIRVNEITILCPPMVITCVWGVGFPDLFMMWPRTSYSSTIKVHLKRLKVRPLAAS